MTEIMFIMVKLVIQDILEAIRIAIIVLVELVLVGFSIVFAISTFYAFNKTNTDVPFMVAMLILELTVEIVFMKEVEQQLRKLPRGF